jgi:5'-phosphate synthase pdxT subunit
MKIGVLALQGDFAEHIAVLHKLGVEAVAVRLPEDLKGLDGLIIPGGESTTISRLMEDYEMLHAIKDFASGGSPIFGTCAGMILLSEKDSDPLLKPLQLINMTVKRNAFGRQRESFETELDVPALGDEPFHAVFIRAPVISEVNSGAEIIARLEDGTVVAVRQGNLLAAAFHPELTDDPRFHLYFLDMVSTRKTSGGAIAEGNH